LVYNDKYKSFADYPKLFINFFVCQILSAIKGNFRLRAKTFKKKPTFKTEPVTE